jgi:hypothetical protein
MKQEQFLQDIREGYGTIAQCLVSMAEGKAKSRDIIKACERIEKARAQLANIVGESEATRLTKEQLAFIF